MQEAKSDQAGVGVIISPEERLPQFKELRPWQLGMRLGYLQELIAAGTASKQDQLDYALLGEVLVEWEPDEGVPLDTLDLDAAAVDKPEPQRRRHLAGVQQVFTVRTGASPAPRKESTTS